MKLKEGLDVFITMAKPTDHDGRLEDYLNDKFQTASDLNDLNGLLATVETQKRQLDAQVSGDL